MSVYSIHPLVKYVNIHKKRLIFARLLLIWFELTGVACWEAVYVVYAGCGNGDVYLYACCAFE